MPHAISVRLKVKTDRHNKSIRVECIIIASFIILCTKTTSRQVFESYLVILPPYRRHLHSVWSGRIGLDRCALACYFRDPKIGESKLSLSFGDLSDLNVGATRLAPFSLQLYRETDRSGGLWVGWTVGAFPCQFVFPWLPPQAFTVL